MTFKKDGRLHRVAYDWHPDWRKTRPERTSICKLFWLTVFAVFLAWPWIVISRIFGWIVRIVGAVPAFLLFGYVPEGQDWRFLEQDSLPFRRIDSWPVWKGMRIEPGKILLLIGASVLLAWALKILLFDALIMRFFVGTPLGNILGVLIIIASLFFWIRAVVKNTESWQLTKEFVRAKKNHFCPLVEFK